MCNAALFESKEKVLTAPTISIDHVGALGVGVEGNVAGAGAGWQFWRRVGCWE